MIPDQQIHDRARVYSQHYLIKENRSGRKVAPAFFIFALFDTVRPVNSGK